MDKKVSKSSDKSKRNKVQKTIKSHKLKKSSKTKSTKSQKKKKVRNVQTSINGTKSGGPPTVSTPPKVVNSREKPQREEAPEAENTEKAGRVMMKLAKKREEKKQEVTPKEKALEPTQHMEEISSIAEPVVKDDRKPPKMDDGYEDFGPGAELDK